MRKIALFFPEAQMAEYAQKVLDKRKLEVIACKAIRTADSVNEARNAAMNGARIIVARGYQAKIIREYTNIPVVEIHLTYQEICLYIKKAMQIAGKTHPYIALIAFENMVPDLSYITELFDIRFSVFTIERAEEAGGILDQIKEDRPDVIIGGRAAIAAAQEQGYLTVFYSATAESVDTAVEQALRLDETMENQMKTEAEYETVLDTSFSGIVRVNREADIIVMNHFVEHLTGKQSDEVIGKPISKIIPEISGDQIREILDGESESITTSINIKNDSYMVLIAPIEVGKEITGAIISLRRNAAMSTTRRTEQEMMLRGFVTRTTFDSLKTRSRLGRKLFDEARIFSLSSSPVLICLPKGISGMNLAKAIHNNSGWKSGPFTSLDLTVIPPEKQEDALFKSLFPSEMERAGVDGSGQGAMVLADHGSIYLKGIECLTRKAQRQLVRMMSPRSEIRTDAQSIHALDVHLIASTRTDLRMMMEHGEVDPDFFYMMSALPLVVPPLKDRPEDLEDMFENVLTEFSRKYHKNIRLTEGGRHFLRELSWDGNDVQVRAFAERLVLTARKRLVDEVVLQKLYEALYPKVRHIDGNDRYVLYRAPEADQILELLRQYQGSRKEVAHALGISTTTLWRRMKKYGIEAGSTEVDNSDKSEV